MGDGLNLSKDKRHKSTSSLASGCLEGTRSERKLDIRASIPEVEDQFTIAENRCDELQEKIDLVKTLRKKRKLKKKSMTRLNEQPVVPDMHTPLISVCTQPKKKVTQQGARLRRVGIPPNPTRRYIDPATVEQHRMLGQVWGYNSNQHYQQAVDPSDKRLNKVRTRLTRADGDGGMCGQSVQLDAAAEVGCGQEDDFLDYSDNEMYQSHDGYFQSDTRNVERVTKPLVQKKSINHVSNVNQVPKWIDSSAIGNLGGNGRGRSRLSPPSRLQEQKIQKNQEERQLVELFNKSRGSSPLPSKQKKEPERRQKKQPRPISGDQVTVDQTTIPSEEGCPSKRMSYRDVHNPRRVKYRSRGYEMPTVASQMKQTDIRYRVGVYNRTNIPFVASKSTAPSHNIGVNIQQVLNGLKIQQPLSGIPLTIAHHMGLGHVPTYGVKGVTTQPSLNNHEINAIKLGQRLLLLPSYKCMSYNRLLSLYREGEGMVPRFLRAISRPHYFYTSMYNSLATTRDDIDGATSKGGRMTDSRQKQLSEYAGLYHEYEHIDKLLKESSNHNPDLERRRQELLQELTAREDQIKKLVHESSISTGDVNLASLRASASAAEDNCRHSSFKLNTLEPQ